MAYIMKGSAVVASMKESILQEVGKLEQKGIYPCMVMVRCGSQPDDISYENGARKRFASLNIILKTIELPESVDQATFIQQLHRLNGDPSVHGILLLRPLPSQISEYDVKYEIDHKKDVDCMNPVNIAKVFEGDESGYCPGTPEAVLQMLHFYNIPLSGKRVAVIGRSLVVGRTLAMMLLKENATVTICHTKTPDLGQAIKGADIIISSVGKAKMITKDMVSPRQIIIDVGINLDENGKLCGDVDFAQVEPIVDKITPVPGGIGTVTTSCIAEHVVHAARLMLNPQQ